MPSMSYCMFENSANEMQQVVSSMEDARDIEDLDLSEYEQDGMRDLYKYCKRFLKEYSRLANEFIEENEYEEA